ncbi:MAG: type II secretion system protein [Phycisphaerae bacterium]|nr:type II secretion system protein [Phycisphaerae bacterium]
MKKETVSKRPAFTIVELLTVMSVIALLIGLLVPALNLVQDHARNLQQRAQFHAIQVGIDMFVAESGYGTYPPSNENDFPPYDPILGQDSFSYGGAQKLAEALVGYDLLGYHPQSSFRSDARSVDGSVTPPQPYVVYPNNPTRRDLEARIGPFLDLENANAFKIRDIYRTPTGLNPENYVLCDVYAKRRHSGKKTGMPILFYRARTEWYDQSYDSPAVPAPANMPGTIEDDIYYYPDNQELLLLGMPEDNTVRHELADGINDWQDFERMILNPQIPTNVLRRPYRAGSYILISAGKDGRYGTADDITNFDKKE